MKKYLIVMMVLVLMAGGCKKKEKFADPAHVMAKWAKSIQELNYRLYSQCEAYPKSEPVFREMYRDYYFTDMMVTSVEEPNPKDIRKDHEGITYIHCSVSFEGNVVTRKTGKPSQVVRGDAVFIKFNDGKRMENGWLLSNRTFITINR